MPIFMVLRETFRFPTPDSSTGGHPVLHIGDLFTGDAAGTFIEGSDPAAPGFVLFTDAIRMPSTIAPIATPEAKTDFCEVATIQGRVDKSDRNYLLAVAYYRSGNLATFGKPGDPRVGPFRFSMDEWRDGIALAKAQGQDYWVAHIFDPMLQINIAAIRSAKAIEDFKTANQGSLPRPLELFFFEQLGAHAMPLLAMEGSNKTCKEAIDFDAPTNSYAEEIKSQGDKKLGDFIAEVRAGLAAGFSASRADVNRLPAHLQFFTDEDRAPWLAVARMLSGKNLQASAAKLPAQFMSVVNVLHPPRSPIFVDFCLKFSGVAAAQQSAPADVANPVAWKQWQGEAPSPAPAGAVVVTKAPNVGILASTPSGNTLQVIFASDGTGVVDVGPQGVDKGEVDGPLRWLELAGGAAAGLGDLGSIFAKFESGGLGPRSVSTGRNDPGGVSYGTFQMTSNAGNVTRFIAQSPFAGNFAGLQAGTAAFTQAWLAAVDQNPEQFKELEHAFIKKENFDPLVAAINAPGFDVTTRSRILQDVVWSVAVQHGPGDGKSVITNARAKVAGVTPAQGIAYDKALIEQIYAERGRLEAGSMVHFPRVVDGQMQASLERRFEEEMGVALKVVGSLIA
jgi:hypothetical protein